MRTQIITTTFTGVFLLSISTAYSQSVNNDTVMYLPDKNYTALVFGFYPKRSAKGSNSFDMVYRKYDTKTFTDLGISGGLVSSSTPTGLTPSARSAGADYLNHRYFINEGVDFTYKFQSSSVEVYLSRSRRFELSNKMEAYGGLTLGVEYKGIFEEIRLDLVDSTKILAGTGGAYYYGSFDPFRAVHYNNDFYYATLNEQGLLAKLYPTVGMNYFISEKLAIGTSFSIAGINVLIPLYGELEIEQRYRGENSIISQQAPGNGAVKFSFELTVFGGVHLTYSLRSFKDRKVEVAP